MRTMGDAMSSRHVGLGAVALGLALASPFMATVPALIVAFYLAVLFQTFGRPQASEHVRGSPFRSGLHFSDPEGSRWKGAVLVVGTFAVAVGGVVIALTGGPKAIVGGSLAFLGFLVGTPQLLWAFQMVGRDWASEHPNVVLNGAFLGPPVAFIVTAILVAGFD